MIQIPIWASLMITFCAQITVLDGWLSQYAQNPTDATLKARQEFGQLPSDMSVYDGVVAVEDCEHVGKTALLNFDGEWYLVKVFDCLAAGDGDWMQEKNIIAELGYYLAKDLDVLGQGGLEGSLYIFEYTSNVR